MRRAERSKLALSAPERTRLSGNRDVPFKTRFPPPLRIVLNEWVMYPLHWLQKLNARNPRSMVIYAEFSASHVDPVQQAVIHDRRRAGVHRAGAPEPQLAGDGAFTARCSAWLEQRPARRALLTHSCTAALEMAAILAASARATR